VAAEGKMWWPYAPKPNGGGGRTVVDAYVGAVVGKKGKDEVAMEFDGGGGGGVCSD
jgi:hypothetical protein